jgi:hypothetical protein
MHAHAYVALQERMSQSARRERASSARREARSRLHSRGSLNRCIRHLGTSAPAPMPMTMMRPIPTPQPLP